MKEILAFSIGICLLIISGCVKSPSDNIPVISTTEVKPLITGIIKTADNGTHLGNIGTPSVKDKIYFNNEDIYLNREPMYFLEILPNPSQNNFILSFILRQASHVLVWIEPGTPSYTLVSNTNYGSGKILAAPEVYINSFILIINDFNSGLYQLSMDYFKNIKLMPGFYRLYLQITPLDSDKTYLLWNDLMIYNK